jgi:hypothetical protein
MKICVLIFSSGPIIDYTNPIFLTFVTLSVPKCNVFARKPDMSRCRYIEYSNMDGIRDIAVPSGETYVHKFSMAHPPSIFNTARRKLAFLHGKSP